MMRDAVRNNASHAVWWKRAFRWLATASGLIASGLGTASSPVVAQGTDFRSAAAAPVAWQVFAKQLQSHFQQRLSGDDTKAGKVHAFMAKHVNDSDKASFALAVRAWVRPDGKIERLAFRGLDDDAVAADLRVLLARGDVGPPPPDMLQPLHLRVSLLLKALPAERP